MNKIRTYGLPWLLTLATVVLASLRGLLRPDLSLGSYDPQLAVLSITAIAIIWYTTFTYESLREGRSRQLEQEFSQRRLLFELAYRLAFNVGMLPLHLESVTDLAEIVFWPPERERTLSDYTGLYDREFSEDIHAAVEALRWLRIHGLRTQERARGVIIEILPPQELWYGNIQTAARALFRIAERTQVVPIEELRGVPGSEA